MQLYEQQPLPLTETGWALLDDPTEGSDRRTNSDRYRVVIASRDASVIETGSRSLTSAGFDVTTARDFLETLTVCCNVKPDLLVLDPALRDSKGLGLCGAIRRMPSGEHVPMLALCSENGQALQAMEEGSTDVAMRPFNWQILSHRAVLLVKNQQALEELDKARSLLKDVRTHVESEREQMRRMKACDHLTGLPNRTTFEQLLESALSASRAGVTVLFVDLDRFQTVNQAFGRNVGNEILRQVAGRLSSSLRSGDLMSRHGPGPAATALARLSGDEYTMMISNVPGAEEAEAVAQRLAKVLTDPFDVDDEKIYLTSSIGVALSPHDGEDAERLLQHAELAMNEAKRNGGGLVKCFSKSLNPDAAQRVKLGRMLRTAVEREELKLHYQPLVDLGDHRILGAEALLRWEHSELGSISPAEFVPLAEEIGLMVELGEWVLRTACEQLRTWLDQGMPPIRVAINVSRCQLVRGDLANVVRRVLEDTNLHASMLELELSERGVLRADPTILRQLADIKEMGVRLSVDDFGTGNSAIAYLKRFPLDALKIDQSYVKGVVGCENDAAIASATIAMAHQLHLNVVAEGVEDRGQLDFLRRCGCDEFQGFLFSPAVPPEDFRRMVSDELPVGVA